MEDSTEKYVPGKCNIGKDEIDIRVRLGWTGFVISVGLWATLIFLDIPAIFRIVLFIPAFISAIGFLEAQLHFCVYFAMKGVYNVKSKPSKTETIMLVPLIKKDLKKGYELLFYSLLIASTVALLAYFSVKL